MLSILWKLNLKIITENVRLSAMFRKVMVLKHWNKKIIIFI